jgi:hypothetical protein
MTPEEHQALITCFEAKRVVRKPEGLIGTAQAAERLGITRQGVGERIRRGRLSATKIKGVWAMTERALK